MSVPVVTGDAEGLLSVGAVAELFGVHPRTVARWAEAETLRAYRTVGKHRRFTCADVARFVLERRGTPDELPPRPELDAFVDAHQPPPAATDHRPRARRTPVTSGGTS